MSVVEVLFSSLESSSQFTIDDLWDFNSGNSSVSCKPFSTATIFALVKEATIGVGTKGRVVLTDVDNLAIFLLIS